MDYPGWGKSQSDAGSGSAYTPCLNYDWGKEVWVKVSGFRGFGEFPSGFRVHQVTQGRGAPTHPA